MTSQQTRRIFLQTTAVLAALPYLPACSKPSTRISNVLGTGVVGTANDGDNAEGTAVNNPFGVVIGPDGRLYWVDYGTHRVLALDLQSKRISVVAGTGVKGYSGDGGPATKADMAGPHEIRFDSKGNLYIVETDSSAVRHVDMKTGTISTLVGTGEAGYGGDDGPGQQAQLKLPISIALDKSDNLYICDIGNNRIRRMDAATGMITTFAGTGEPLDTPDEAPLQGTPMRGPRSMDIAPDGTIYVVLREGHKVLMIDPAKGQLKRLAGSGAAGYSGDGGPSLDATLNGPKGVALGSDGGLYVCDTENHVVRRLDLTTGKISTAVGTGQPADGADGDPRKCALKRPHGVFVHGSSIYIGDSDNNRIRMLQI
jgi:streptogramin lyase